MPDTAYDTSTAVVLADILSTMLLLEELTLRIAAYWLISPSESESEALSRVEKAIDMQRLYNEATSPDLRIQGIKLICDGTVDACTAALSKPYSHNKVEAKPM